MKTLFALMMLFSFSVHAQYEPDYELEKLDVLKTCTKGTIRETNGLMALAYHGAHKWWNFKDQFSMHHPDYKQWHGSLAGLIAQDPTMNQTAPFFNGVITNENFIRSFAVIAYANDITHYNIVIKRLDCVGEDTVIFVSHFYGLQVKRDERGCITHGLKYELIGNFQFQFVDYQTPSGNTVRKLYRDFVHLNPDDSIRVKDELARLAQGPANIEPNLANCKTYDQMVREFEDQIAQ